MALQLYTNCNVFINGQLLVEAVSVSLDHKSNAHAASTLSKGFAGMSPGAAVCEIKISEVVPRAGVDFDAVASSQTQEIVEIAIYRASKKVLTKGFVTDVTESLAVNKEPSYDFTCMCTPVEENTL